MVLPTVIGARGSTSVNSISLRHIVWFILAVVVVAVVNGLNGTHPHIWK